MWILESSVQLVGKLAGADDRKLGNHCQLFPVDKDIVGFVAADNADGHICSGRQKNKGPSVVPWQRAAFSFVCETRFLQAEVQEWWSIVIDYIA